jgi:tetratricopeptide (TPR) repeat protein
MLESFDFGSPLVMEALTGKLATLNSYNGLRVYSEYFFDAMNRLRERYLNVALSDIALPSINPETKAITKSLKLAASEAALVEKEQLTAQEWFERGYIFEQAENFNEAIRCYSEVIRLKPDDAYAYHNRGISRRSIGDLDGAIKDYSEAIRLKPDYVDAYSNRGAAHKEKGDLDEAVTDCSEAIHLKPDYAYAYNNRGAARKERGDTDDAIKDYSKAIHLKPDYVVAYFNRALLWEQKKNFSKAIADYQKYLDLGGGIGYDDQKAKESIRLLKKKKK